MNFFVKYRSGIVYGLALAILLFLLKWLELRLVIFSHAMEIYIGVIAVLFTALGIWLALKLAGPRVEMIVVEKKVYTPIQKDFFINEEALRHLGLSKREMEVLQLMADGLSNQEIGSKLFVSLNTIKTHSSRLFEKMEVTSRTQAIEKGRRLMIIR